MDKGRMIYVDESGNLFVTRQLNCDMRPVRSGYGMHIVNTFRYGKLRSAAEFTGFVRQFAEKYESREAKAEDGLVREILCVASGKSEKSAVPGRAAMVTGYEEADQAVVDAAAPWLELNCYCYVMHGDNMTIFCGMEAAEKVCRRADAFEPPLDEREFVSILETLKSEGSISPSAQDLIIHLLELLMRDWGSEISYYVYDLDFGRRFEPGLFSDREGYVDLSCDQALYRDLVRTGF